MYRKKGILFFKRNLRKNMLRITCIVLLSICLIVAIIFIALLIIYPSSTGCKPTITTASGFAVSREICAGNLIFEENFDKLDKHKWQPDVTFWGGGNGEFEWYTADDENSFVKNKKLHIKPTLTENKITRDQVENGYIRLDDCTDPDKKQCERHADGKTIIINPIRSARLNTEKSFNFKYGRVEVIAKLPTGDWLWPAVWLLPAKLKYGEWPRSGEIDLMESRGNINYTDPNGRQFGVKQTGSTLHFGTQPKDDKFESTTFSKVNETGYNNGFHIYEFIWNETGIVFYVDRMEIGSVPVGDGFWKRGNFNGDNIWASGTKMAPFDQEFYFIINLAVGGTTDYFPPNFLNQNGKKPWNNTSPSAMRDFWINRNQWLPTWDFDNDGSSLIVESVKVWAI